MAEQESGFLCPPGGGHLCGARSPVAADSHASDEFIFWSKDETYFEECRKHFLHNKTWGEPRSAFVDKIQVKEIVQKLNVSGLEIPTTLAILDEETLVDFTQEIMQELPQPYIIKASHTSGGVSRVGDGEYKCFKRCIKSINNRPLPLDNNRYPGSAGEALEAMKAQATADLQRDFMEKHGETQYNQLPRRLIIEEDIMVGEIQNDVSFWYVANGQPLFVSLQCEQTEERDFGADRKRFFVSTRYERLPMYLSFGTCAATPPKPDNWDDQVRIVTQLASIAPPGIVRLDLYTGGDKIYFSEFTFTTNYCAKKMGFHPRVADGLLYAVEHSMVDPARATPEFVERTISDKSWALVTLKNGIHLSREESKVYPSPVDLCEDFHKERNVRYAHGLWQKSNYTDTCLNATRDAAPEPLRCLVSSGDDEGTLKPVGVQQHPSFQSVMARVDWCRAIILLTIVIAMTYTGTCVQPQKNQFVNQFLYYCGMAGFIYFATDAEGLWSGNAPSTILHESYRAFVYLHPMESSAIAISHFATYWFSLASWNSKSLRNLLFWQFLYELVTASVNEFTHHNEHQNDVRCMRIAFIGAFKNYAIDNIFRAYIFPPFFVYGYLLPTFVFHWFLNFALWIFPCFISQHPIDWIKKNSQRERQARKEMTRKLYRVSALCST